MMKEELTRKDVEAVKEAKEAKKKESRDDLTSSEIKKETLKAFGKSFAMSFICGMAIGILSAAINKK